MIEIFLLLGSFLLTVQGVITLVWMLWSWEKEPDGIKSEDTDYSDPKVSFTALVPMRFEEKVVSDTIKAINEIDYPNNLKEIIVIVRHDDKKTIDKAQEVISKLNNNNHTVLVLVNSQPINKPVSLNQGLLQARNQIIAIFDAEDEPDRNIYKIVNTVMQKEKVDIVQSGVQLMNYNSFWFSPLNVMEYFFWFKSGLHFITDMGNVSLLGGNTVFIKKKFLKFAGGWDENCLTEDADIGIRLSTLHAKTKIIFNSTSVTKEETPSSTDSFIKQRTRWHQGFLQIFFKGDWKNLPTLKQRVVAAYILLAPFFQIILFIYTPFGIWTSLNFKLPVIISIISYVPFYILFLIIFNQIVGLFEFTKTFNLKFYWYLPVKVLVTYFPYLGLLTYSAFRALIRFFLSSNSWEKTVHLNAHREFGFSGNKDINTHN